MNARSRLRSKTAATDLPQASGPHGRMKGNSKGKSQRQYESNMLVLPSPEEFRQEHADAGERGEGGRRTQRLRKLRARLIIEFRFLPQTTPCMAQRLHPANLFAPATHPTTATVTISMSGLTGSCSNVAASARPKNGCSNCN
jgi:hypothetical protein